MSLFCPISNMWGRCDQNDFSMTETLRALNEKENGFS